MREVADSWLVEVDRQALPSYLGALAGTGASASPELGESIRRITFPWAVPLSLITATGLTRFAMPIEWEGGEGAFRERFAARPVRVHPLRRHDRFLATRLGGTPLGGRDVWDVAVTGDKILAGRGAEFLPRRSARDAGLPSRAGEKLAEALAFLTAQGFHPASWHHWLELGAFPGGMTTELSRRGHLVTALDVHPPTAAMISLSGVTCVTGQAENFVPNRTFDALLCDVNGSPGRVIGTVSRLASMLRPGGLVVHTLKLPSWSTSDSLTREALARFDEAGLGRIAVRHLRQNRQELTLFARKAGKECHGDLCDR